MFSIFSEPHHIPHLPHFPRSPDTPLPNYKALVIGIDYVWSPDGLGPGNPVDDVKNIKKTLKGAGVRPFVRPFANAFSIYIYIRLM
jgi:hypothetical protein